MARAKRESLPHAPGFWKRETKDGQRFDFKHPDGRIKGGYDTLTAARKARHSAFNQAANGGWASPSRQTLGGYIEEWLAQRKRDVSRELLSPSTWAGYDLNLRKHVIPRLGDRPLGGLTKADVNKLIDHLEEQRKSAGTIRNVFVPLRKLLNDAVGDELIAKNPASKARLPAAAGFVGKELPEAHIAAIRANLTGFWLHWFDVTLGAGLRLGELRALRWRHWDKPNNILRIEEAYWRGHLKKPKSDAGRRRVPVFVTARQAFEALAALAVSEGRYSPDELIFPSRVGTPMNDNNIRERVWIPALTKADLVTVRPDARPKPLYRIHDLRHTCASRLVRNGVRDVKLIQAMVGHSDAAILLNRYSHLTDEALIDAAKRFDPAMPIPIEEEPVIEEKVGSTEVAP